MNTNHLPRFTFIFIILLALMAVIIPSCQNRLSAPPETTKGNVVDTLHGVVIPDPYRWLEDQDSPETRAWIEAQNQYSEEYFKSEPMREALKKRYQELFKVDRITTPDQRGKRFFVKKRTGDQELYIYYTRDSLNGEDKVLIDPHTLSDDYTVDVGTEDITNDGAYFAYHVRDGGEEESRIKIMKVETKELLADSLPRADYYGFDLTGDLSGFYYTKSVDEIGSVYYHKMGTDVSKDKKIFGGNYGREKIIASSMSENRRWLLIYVYNGSSGVNDIYYIDLKGDGEIKTLVENVPSYFEGQFADDALIINTNWMAPNGRLMKVDLKKPAMKNWMEIVPETEWPIEFFSLAGGKIFVNYLINVSSKVKPFDLKGTEMGEIEFPTLGTVGAVTGRWDSQDAFFSFASFHYPTTIFHLNTETGDYKVWHKSNVPVNTDNTEVKQVWYKSKDGTEIPMFMVHKKGLKLDGNRPVLMYGYGGFRTNSNPYFSTYATIFAEHDGVYIYPALRGGSEFGENWHEAAMFEKKQNTFDDFIAAAEWLIANNYTKPSKIAIMGGSNGGLLVGACMTQRPDLFGAVICTYPLLDMLRYHKFLMGPYWISEYGSADDAEQFKYIYAYSPYQNVKPGVKYPATIFSSGDSDTRVDPMHARKMTAMVQANNASDKPILLMYDTKSGHLGGKPLSDIIDEAANELGFLFRELDIK
ncbi:MAG: prolyl oligopeptidase family serine peptidase [Candidatus Zixiibacteriota bacterium]